MPLVPYLAPRSLGAVGAYCADSLAGYADCYRRPFCFTAIVYGDICCSICIEGKFDVPPYGGVTLISETSFLPVAGSGFYVITLFEVKNPSVAHGRAKTPIYQIPV